MPVKRCVLAVYLSTQQHSQFPLSHRNHPPTYLFTFHIVEAVGCQHNVLGGQGQQFRRKHSPGDAYDPGNPWLHPFPRCYYWDSVHLTGLLQVLYETGGAFFVT